MSGEEKYSYVNEAGRTVHVFEDEFGNESEVTELNMFDYIFTGEQWCPHCLARSEHKSCYWGCPSCGFTITDEEVEESNGIPSLGAALDWRKEHLYGE